MRVMFVSHIQDYFFDPFDDGWYHDTTTLSIYCYGVLGVSIQY